MKRYADVIFLQSDDYDEFAAHIERETGDAWPQSTEWQSSAFNYLMQWYTCDSLEYRSEPGYGTSDDIYDHVDEYGTYQISHNGRLGYVGLTEIGDFPS